MSAPDDTPFAPAPAEDRRGSALAALWLGGLSLVAGCCPPAGLLFALAGVVLGARGLGSSAPGVALAGMLLSAAGAVGSAAMGTLVGVIIVREEELKQRPPANPAPFVKG